MIGCYLFARNDISVFWRWVNGTRNRIIKLILNVCVFLFANYIHLSVPHEMQKHSTMHNVTAQQPQ